MAYDNIIFRTAAFMLMTAALAVSGGCVKEMEGGLQQESECIAFNARLSSEQTKAMPVTRLSGDARIIGYVYDSWPQNEEQFRNMAPWEMLENEIFTFDGDQLEAPEKLIRWKEAADEGSMLRVYAYAPAEDDAMEVSYGTPGSFSLPSIAYTVPTDISRQTDIIVATAEVGTSFNKNIPLTFDHALTAIKFKAGFGCKVEKIAVIGAASSGTYVMNSGWEGQSYPATYTISFGEGKTVSAGEMITDEAQANVLLMIPQTFSDDATATIRLTYDGGKTLTTPLKGIKWEAGRMITYTLHKQENYTEAKTVYFDLTAGNVTIDDTGYAGHIYVAGVSKPVNGTHDPDNRYYVYQSSTLTGFAQFGKDNTGYATVQDYDSKAYCRIPKYEPVKYNSTLWSEWITDNTCVEDVIEIWDDGRNIRTDGSSAPDEEHIGTAVVRDAGRSHTRNYIKIGGKNTTYNVTIDNIYSVIQVPVDGGQAFRKRDKGGIAYMPVGGTDLTVNLIGDNRMGCLHIDNETTDRITIEGTGSLTVADADFLTVKEVGDYSTDFGDTKGYISNFWGSAIGNNTDDGIGENVYNLYISGGVIFAGATKTEDCTAIGGGGNGFGQVFITGGKVTAVAATAGTAIGGGMGHTANGGPGEVHISGGNVYAYNFANRWDIPSAAIGGGSSFGSIGREATVSITGGNVYAQTALGTAIGGGSSKTKNGGGADVTISGGSVIAKSLSVSETLKAGAGIGGGTGGSDSGANGGKATVTIAGNPIIRTGSIGGGKTNNTSGRIGSATIDISGGDIQAQFVMAAGAGIKPSFTMTGGLIRNSDTEDAEYAHIQDNGGAVYLEDGTFKMSGGEIRRCSALKGGAIYIKGTASTEFEMTGGKITECASKMDGGAVYLEGGVVTLAGGEVSHNLANNGNGGGFCIVGGNFSMPAGGDAIVYENAAFSQSSTGGKGGGLYVTSTGSPVEVGIISGTITENSSDRLGGGIAVDMAGNDAAAATVTVGTAGGGEGNPSISSNHTIIMGGGLYANGAKANITINSGKIKGNTISGYVSNPDVANEGGMVTLNGGDVTHVVVTYNNNGSYLGQAVKKATQKIVTATNSTMAVPEEFTLLGYKLEGWNTRPDGKGTDYIEGQTMNLSANLTLYAQWSRN